MRPLLRAALVAALLLVPPWLLQRQVLHARRVTAADVARVARTGRCPGSPPDGAAYPCTVDEYVTKQMESPWAGLPLMMFYPAWFAACGVWLALYARTGARPAPVAVRQED